MTPVAALARPPRRTRRVNEHLADQRRTGLLFATPTALIVGVVFVVPLVLLAVMAMSKWPLIGASSPNGGANFAAVTDPLFVQAAIFTLVYTIVTTVVLSLVALGLALLVQQSRPGTALYRTAFFIPAAIGISSSALIFYGLYTEQSSGLNDLLAAVGIGPIAWVATPEGAFWSTVVLVVWRFSGFYMLILLTGLQAIPDEVYEAARVDGAGPWRTFVSVTVPLLRPSIALMLILSVTGSVLAFDQFYVLTSGGPDNSTVTLVIALYRKAFVQYDLGTAAALSLIVLGFLLVLNLVQFALLRRDNTV
ncbi:sugar ABC transporter permease [Rathayibacter sp. VKM Ac-2760]|uniref:carbohydrate ABC transporter permease n=1 Tax=Rathayibacter sp. VKM Ac-2760 TaxID=2609253 RepID=UPI001317B6D7|nr:sugar ABC transporter permease [Rathayibacter sp. VKM Ac-2760]QHC58788.1 ABC transporter permease subunit [Rathayibacter sp. VKM Ac-2760]